MYGQVDSLEQPDMKDWEELADWYDRKQGDSGDLWHRALIDPTLLKVVGKCRGKEVMDLGCGNGYLSRRLARGGAKVTAVDWSPQMIMNARAHDPKGSLGIRYVRSDAGKLNGIPNARFDLVFANMSLDDIKDAEDAVREVSRILRQGGRFVASISHPCFEVGSTSMWVAEKAPGKPPVVYRKVRRYRQLFVEDAQWNLSESKKMFTKSFHRPLNWYARTLRSHGLAITALEEPVPTKEFVEEEQKKPGDLDGAGLLEVPLHLVLEAVKL
jgi:ubiquinone/menaquinone biosynthesis C-methylase UbiE